MRDGLETLLNDPDRGIFRSPYLRICTPFKSAGDRLDALRAADSQRYTQELKQSRSLD